MKMDNENKKIISTNRKARRNYEIFDTYEAGISLRGNEVKSLRNQSCSIEESFVRIEQQEALLYNMHIPEFIKASYFKSDPLRIRKLLLHKKEITRLSTLTSQKGYTVVPLKVYSNEKGVIKIEIAIAKGRRLYDKREKIKEEFQKREAQRQMKKYWNR